jgi:Protein of unknown function (DUF3040)
MSLAPHERRVLADIENSLSGTDPALATMLATFTVAGSRKIRRPRWPGRQARTGVVIALILMALAALIIWGLLATASHPPRCAPHGRQDHSSGTVVTCAPVDGAHSPGAMFSSGQSSGK